MTFLHQVRLILHEAEYLPICLKVWNPIKALWIYFSSNILNRQHYVCENIYTYMYAITMKEIKPMNLNKEGDMK